MVEGNPSITRCEVADVNFVPSADRWCDRMSKSFYRTDTQSNGLPRSEGLVPKVTNDRVRDQLCSQCLDWLCAIRDQLWLRALDDKGDPKGSSSTTRGTCICGTSSPQYQSGPRCHHCEPSISDTSCQQTSA